MNRATAARSSLNQPDVGPGNAATDTNDDYQRELTVPKVRKVPHTC